ncbi:hypothetical protein Airi02_042480 [Actinoallomurus iriomotensis]|uniref:Uncharacterized protein n=1 Tax=Actinoallomurus iriomotensis TaxID=478107 RepID=A0A9W6W0G0_9ACTN|nr:hypothetical protein Airi02_042480 [Actinoallomurus iriomotensis]
MRPDTIMLFAPFGSSGVWEKDSGRPSGANPTGGSKCGAAFEDFAAGADPGRELPVSSQPESTVIRAKATVTVVPRRFKFIPILSPGEVPDIRVKIRRNVKALNGVMCHYERRSRPSMSGLL